MNFLRTLVFSVLLFSPALLLAQPPAKAAMPAKHRLILKRYCLGCHNREDREGSVNLEDLSFDISTIASAEAWQKILGAMNSGEMPPDSEDQLSDQEKVEFLEDLSQQMVVARKRLSDAGGKITMRRLNRREYVNTIRDLLGVQISADELPDDESPGSFDTEGASLFFSSDQFEQYFSIAKKALGVLSAERPWQKRTVRLESEKVSNRKLNALAKRLLKVKQRAEAFYASDKPPTDFGFIDEARVEFEMGGFERNYPYLQWLQQQPESKHGAILGTSFNGAYIDEFALPKMVGRYTIRVRAGGYEGMPKHLRFLELGQKEADARQGEHRVLACRQVHGTINEPEVYQFEVDLIAGASNVFGVRQRQPNNRDAARRSFRAAKAKNGIGPKPAIWVDWIEWEGPHEMNPTAQTMSENLYANLSGKSDTEVKQVLADFAQRAFRISEPTHTFIDKLYAMFVSQRQSGHSHAQALTEPLAVILSSPGFLYLDEPATDDAPHKIDDLRLASRLSYLLWSSMPDERMLTLARAGKLSQPEVLAAETDRMLNDPKAWEFISGFAHQWLGMERLDFFQFNEQLYPEFDENLKQAARLEIYHTFDHLLKENLHLGKLLKSDTIVINDLLAGYYGVEGVKGESFREVDIPEGLPRGGLLSTVAVLAMGSDGERTSPVERGAWVMRKLLNDPPPPAPANVPQLSRLDGQNFSSRARQSAHMEQPQCAQCHRKIDPIGFGLENFDAAGKWRDEEVTTIATPRKKSKVVRFPIDPHGRLPNGTEFANFAGLQNAITGYESAFARGFTEALIAYGLGRPYGFSDHELSESIMRTAKAQDMRVPAFIHALVQSSAFRTK